MKPAPLMSGSAVAVAPLPSLRVRWFRGIEDLEIPKLARVSLFVGQNGAGKSSLLEAARIIASAGDPRALLDLVTRREGFSPGVWRGNDVEAIGASLEYLFFRRPDQWTNVIEVESPDGRYGHVRISRVNRTPEDPRDDQILYSLRETVLEVTVGEFDPVFVPYEKLHQVNRWLAPEENGPVVMLHAEGASRAQVGAMWDAVALTDFEETVLDGLRLVSPEVERVSLVADARVTGLRHVMVRTKGFRDPRPLGLLGSGAVRLFELALAIANARGGLLLVDEVAHGIYYETQDLVWEMIFGLAERLDVQVLATTHSWDSIVGFQYAANRSATEGILYRLDRGDGGRIRPVRYSERDLEIAAEQRIEVR